ncbi:metal ABC transporter permease [Castellaniella sp.]|uniref:metal ABC transporter permease n=1 Tax=Castellaniella sp. TaxID=1955812 RepID=UPI002AFEB064|nr:metal ABC transporter permease [Castellaniella sp.]
MGLWDFLVQPFIDFGFMRRALAGSWALAFAAGPLGVFLVLRRLSLMGDAMAHAILPGVAVGFLTAGLSMTAMTIGGLLTGIIVALLAGLVSRLTPLREDASFAAFYLVSLGLGVLLVSLKGTNLDLMHVLFGTVLGLSSAALVLVTLVSSITLLTLAAMFRVLVAECLDPLFLRAEGRAGAWAHMGFLLLLVLNLVAGFQVLGTLMVVGIMMLPATAARFWVRSVGGQMVLAAILGALASYAGLLMSYYLDLAASPSIILAAGVVHFVSVGLGPHGGLLQALRRSRARRTQLSQSLEKAR